jgi:uncharacterized membrane protein
MSEQIVGLFSTQGDAEAAKQSLEQAGLASEQVVVDSQSIAPRIPLPNTQAKNSAIKGGITGGLLGCIIGLLFGLMVNGISEPGINATPHVSIALLVLGGGLVGAIAMGIIASFVGANVVNSRSKDQKQPLNPQEVHALKVTGTQDEFVEATRIIQNGGDR